MSAEAHIPSNGEPVEESGVITLPGPTTAPLVVMLGISLIAAGLMLGMSMVLVGVVMFVVGVAMWIGALFPGRGHVETPIESPIEKPGYATGATTVTAVERLPGVKPGQRAQVPAVVHPTSAGVKGGLVGAVVMPIPALIWSLTSGHGIWYPANLLLGMVLPGTEKMSMHELEQFRLGYLIPAILIHVATCLVIGLAYGVLLPMLPKIAKEIAWGALLMPVVWTGG